MNSGLFAAAFGRKRAFAACAYALLSAAASSSHAAPITWLAPTAFDSSGSALNQAGNVVSAFSAYGNITVNYGGGSVAFSGLGGVSNDIGFANYQGQTPSGVTNYNGASNSAFGLALSAFLYDGWQQITLKNLTPGASYAVQLFTLDNRGGFSAWNDWFVDPLGNASSRFMLGGDSYVIGSFIADAATESIFVRSDSCHGFDCTGQSGGYRQSNELTNVNAVVLRQLAVPEPSTLLLLAAAGAALVGVRRHKRR